MLISNLRDSVLINPICEGADKIYILSGYATPTMASWHIKQIQSLKISPINITLIVGMCPVDGIAVSDHKNFKSLSQASQQSQELSTLTCQYIYRGAPVHSKLYIWARSDEPLIAFAGSANYTQTAFSPFHRELITECDPNKALEYFFQIEKDSMFCTHGEIENYINIHANHDMSDFVPSRSPQEERNEVSLSFLKRDGNIGSRSGLNWGQRNGREKNQAYIPLPAKIARSDFFPLGGQHFSVITDDRKQLILRVEQENNKAITTPLNNSQIGEYFRNRLGLANGAYVTKDNLVNYGRTDVTFYKIDEEQFFMDFSVPPHL